MFTSFINGILAVTMIVNFTVTTAKTMEAQNKIENAIEAVFGEEEEEIYDLMVIWIDGKRIKVNVSNMGGDNSRTWEIEGYSAFRFEGTGEPWNVDIVTTDETEISFSVKEIRDLR